MSTDPDAAPGEPVTATDDSGITQVQFGTFAGVYRPVVLTVLGALLYLREGWLVGNAGLGGALLVIGGAYLITGTTALSVSSIATNLRMRAGGAFAIIAAALGLEAGGAIGVPLYLAQSIGAVMYLYAFTEGWAYYFPHHPAGLVVTAAFLLVGGVTLASAALAARAQAVMLAVVAVAVMSAFGGWYGAELQAPAVIGRFPQASLLECFAIFFPAATGIMVGVGMSGSLEKPSQSIPKGTMLAWGTTFVVYVLGAVWYATVVPRQELLTNKLAMADHALFGSLVMLGLLSSTLMAALSSLVAAPRLLQAMATHGVVPLSSQLSKVTEAGEPRNATLVTLALCAVGLTAGSLDAIAPILTSFFIMTYLAVNMVVALEQSLGMVSWRPRFRIPTAVPVVGSIACVAGLVLSSPAGGLPEVVFVAGIYLYLTRRKKVDTPWVTVQSGIARTLAAWAALKASQAGKSERDWKPDLLVPVTSTEAAAHAVGVAWAITRHRGSTKIVATHDEETLHARLTELVGWMRSQGTFASWHPMPEERPGQAARLSINAMAGTFFAPNLLLLSAEHMARDIDPEGLQEVIDHARKWGVGVVLTFGTEPLPDPIRSVAVWLSDRHPDWTLDLHVANLDLPVLLAYLLTLPDEGQVRLATVVRDPGTEDAARRFLSDVIELGRLPRTEARVTSGPFLDAVTRSEPADLHLFGLPDRIDLSRLQSIHEHLGGPCWFVQDSGQESALA
jgi:amino acid transporter